ncbi:MAG: type II secretion system minor pseudopilin GspH [Gammaproteobacteria bacterium]|nr:type II secretion system minor pseudopilin GspH [Gammaproteobacteria bacterium]
MPGRHAGFTLLELLLVMTIIGILAATVTLAVSDPGARQRVQTEAERIALAVELARTAALTRNEIWGLSVNSAGYAFQTYDREADEWQVLDEPPFLPRRAEDGLLFAVQAGLGERRQRDEGGDAAPPFLARSDDDAASPAGLPSIAILPGGEITPFEVVVSSGDLPPWSARSDGIARVLAAPQGASVDESTRVR